MPETIIIPNIKGLEPKLAAALHRRGMTTANLNDDFLSTQAFKALQRYLAEITNKKHPEQHVDTLAVLIATEAAKLHEQDQKLSTINRQATANNTHSSETSTGAPSLGTYLANGGNIATFGGDGWADESLPTVVADLTASNNNIATIGPLTSLAMAKSLAESVLNTEINKTDVMSFVRTNGNHWQLSHTERTNNGSLKTTIHNPLGDGACGYRAAAKCLSILQEKHNINVLENTPVIPWDAPKKAVEQQAVDLYRKIETLTATATPKQAAEPQQAQATALPIEKPVTPFNVAAEELESTGVMLSALQGIEKISAVINSQQKELDYWAQVKTDHAFAESLQTQENDTSNDEAIARALQTPQTSTSAAQLESDAALARRLQAEEFNFGKSTNPATSCGQEAASAATITHPPRLIR